MNIRTPLVTLWGVALFIGSIVSVSAATINPTGPFYYPSLAFDAGGLPAVSYASANDLYISTCADVDCGTSITTILDREIRSTNSGSTFVVAHQSSVFVANNGRPVIAYFNDRTNSLNLVRCISVSCSEFLIQPVILGISGLIDPVMAVLGRDGSPRIAYIQESSLKILRCDSEACLFPTISMIASGDIQSRFGFALGTNDAPVFAYQSGVRGALKIAICETASCSRIRTRALDTTGGQSLLREPSVAITSAGLPIVTYSDERASDGTALLKAIVCKNSPCSKFTRMALDKTTRGFFGSHATVLNSDRPVVIYQEGVSAGDINLKLLQCAKTTCRTSENQKNINIALFSGSTLSSSISAKLSADGFVSMVFTDRGGLQFARCQLTACGMNQSEQKNAAIELDE